MFINAAALRPKLVATLQKVGIESGSYWDQIITDALDASYLDIVTAFAARGFTLTQINGWDFGATFQTELALYWALVKGGAAQSYPDNFIKGLDRRADLRGDKQAGILPLPLIVAGVEQAPIPAIKRVSGGVLPAAPLPANPPFTEEA